MNKRDRHFLISWTSGLCKLFFKTKHCAMMVGCCCCRYAFPQQQNNRVVGLPIPLCTDTRVGSAQNNSNPRLQHLVDFIFSCNWCDPFLMLDSKAGWTLLLCRGEQAQVKWNATKNEPYFGSCQKGDVTFSCHNHLYISIVSFIVSIGGWFWKVNAHMVKFLKEKTEILQLVVFIVHVQSVWRKLMFCKNK